MYTLFSEPKLKDKDFSPSSQVSTFIGKMVFLFFPCNQVELFQDSLFYILLCQKLAYCPNRNAPKDALPLPPHSDLLYGLVFIEVERDLNLVLTFACS